MVCLMMVISELFFIELCSTIGSLSIRSVLILWIYLLMFVVRLMLCWFLKLWFFVNYFWMLVKILLMLWAVYFVFSTSETRFVSVSFVVAMLIMIVVIVVVVFVVFSVVVINLFIMCCFFVVMYVFILFV